MRHTLKKICLFNQANAPLWVIRDYFFLHHSHKISPRRKMLVQRQSEFRAFAKNLTLDLDWFTKNIPTWLKAFEKANIAEDAELNCLEIGSWQGQSSVFTLKTFPKAKLTCVDTWEGADEHKSLDTTDEETLSTVEAVFDANLNQFKDRLTKYKGTSYAYFNDHFAASVFDFIYIDGSHHTDDVIVDAVKAFEMLKVGGVMIFDDYFWDYYKNALDNPAGAINAFLRMKRHQLRIICFDSQVVIRKTKDSMRTA